MCIPCSACPNSFSTSVFLIMSVLGIFFFFFLIAHKNAGPKKFLAARSPSFSSSNETLLLPSWEEWFLHLCDPAALMVPRNQPLTQFLTLPRVFRFPAVQETVERPWESLGGVTRVPSSLPVDPTRISASQLRPLKTWFQAAIPELPRSAAGSRAHPCSLTGCQERHKKDGEVDRGFSLRFSV